MSACLHQLRQVLRARVADGDRAVGVQQHQRHRLAEDRAASHHHGVSPGERDLVGLEQAHDAGRGGRSPGMLAHRHAAEAEAGHAVDVLRQRRSRRSRHARRSAPAPGAAAGCRGSAGWHSVARSSPAAVPWWCSPASRRPSTPCRRACRRSASCARRSRRPGRRRPGWSPGSASARRCARGSRRRACSVRLRFAGTGSFRRGRSQALTGIPLAVGETGPRIFASARGTAKQKGQIHAMLRLTLDRVAINIRAPVSGPPGSRGFGV